MGRKLFFAKFEAGTNGKSHSLHWLNESSEYDLPDDEDLTTVFWSHRYKAFIIGSTHTFHSKSYYTSLNNALALFFKTNQDIGLHLIATKVPIRRVARYQVRNRQIEDIWDLVKNAMRAWTTNQE